MNVLLRSASVLAFAAAALAASAQTVFYGGDPNGASQLYTTSRDVLFDDFTLATTTSVASLFGTYTIVGGTVTGLGYQIRKGVSEGNGGTLVASGSTGPATVTTVGDFGGNPSVRVSGAVSGLTLPAGTYFLGLYPVASSSATLFLETTSGANGVGSPLGDGNSFYNSSTFGYNYTSATSLDPDYRDFSLGVVANPTPEPSAFAALGLGAFAFVKRRKRA